MGTSTRAAPAPAQPTNCRRPTSQRHPRRRCRPPAGARERRCRPVDVLREASTHRPGYSAPAARPSQQSRRTVRDDRIGDGAVVPTGRRRPARGDDARPCIARKAPAPARCTELRASRPADAPLRATRGSPGPSLPRLILRRYGSVSSPTGAGESVDAPAHRVARAGYRIDR